MQFLCLCYYSERAFNELTPELGQELPKVCEPHDRALKATGKLRLIGSLGVQDQAWAVRAGKPAAPGPFARSAHPFGAFFIIEADTMAEAVEIASLHPSANLDQKYLGEGGVEVWPIEQAEEPASGRD